MHVHFGSFLNFYIHSEGVKIVGVFCFLSLILLTIFGLNGITVLSIAMTLFIVHFFRDPVRITKYKKGDIIAPADGIITFLDEYNLPDDIDTQNKENYTRISIFMSPLDVHVNRVPVEGEIVKVKYIPGKFVNVTLDKDSRDNERNIVKMISDNGDSVYFTQIAGFLARRIVCDVKKGDKLEAGDKFGIIKFGSRVDVYVPSDYKINVVNGQRMVGGETILATKKK